MYVCVYIYIYRCIYIYIYIYNYYIIDPLPRSPTQLTARVDLAPRTARKPPSACRVGRALSGRKEGDSNITYYNMILYDTVYNNTF